MSRDRDVGEASLSRRQLLRALGAPPVLGAVAGCGETNERDGTTGDPTAATPTDEPATSETPPTDQETQTSTLRKRFDAIESELAALDSLRRRAEERGLPTPYQTVDETVVERFVAYGRADIESGSLSRAEYVADQLERLHGRAVSELEAMLDGEREPVEVPRYRTSESTVEGRSFVAETAVSGQSDRTRRQVVFNGYVGWSQLKDDIPRMQAFGANIVHIELGPRDTVFPPAEDVAWLSNAERRDDVAFVVDTEVAASGGRSLRIRKTSGETPTVPGRIHQSIAVDPDTTYRLHARIWAEGVAGATLRAGDATVQIPEASDGWREVQLTVASGDASTLDVVVEVTGRVDALWIDEVRLTSEGSDANLVSNPGFEERNAVATLTTRTARADAYVAKHLDRAAQHHVAVNLLLSPHYFPDWAYDRWPWLDVEHGSYDKFDPAALAIVEAHLRTLLEVVAGHDALHSLTLSNEPAYRATADRHTRQDWTAHLASVHGTVDALNDAYGAEYPSFQAVSPPTDPAVPRPTPRWYDWVRFNNARHADWHEWLAEIVRDVAPDAAFHAKIHGLTLSNRGRALSRGVDPADFAGFPVSGNDNRAFFDGGPDMLRQYLAFYDLQRSLAVAPVFDAENHLVRDGDDVYVSEQADWIRTALWQGAIHGRSASTMWVWRRATDPTSSAAGSILHRPDCVAAYGRTTLDLNRLATAVTAFQEQPAPVAILYSVTATLYSNDAHDYLDAVAVAYHAASSVGQPVAFESEADLRSGEAGGYEILVVPAATHVEPEVLAGLAAFQEAGGEVVVLGEESLSRDEYSRSLSASDRSGVLEAATVLPAAAEASDVRPVVRSTLADRDVLEVLVHEAGGEALATDVEWRSVTLDGERLLNVANYSLRPRSVRVEVGGEPAGPLRDRIRGERLSGQTIELEPLRPYLLAVDA